MQALFYALRVMLSLLVPLGTTLLLGGWALFKTQHGATPLWLAVVALAVAVGTGWVRHWHRRYTRFIRSAQSTRVARQD